MLTSLKEEKLLPPKKLQLQLPNLLFLMKLLMSNQLKLQRKRKLTKFQKKRIQHKSLKLKRKKRLHKSKKLREKALISQSMSDLETIKLKKKKSQILIKLKPNKRLPTYLAEFQSMRKTSPFQSTQLSKMTEYSQEELMHQIKKKLKSKLSKFLRIFHNKWVRSIERNTHLSRQLTSLKVTCSQRISRVSLINSSR